MTKFNTPRTATQARSAVTSTGQATTTHEGGPGFVRDPKSELFLTAVSTLVEDTFYETTADRNTRLAALTGQVAVTDPDWVVRFVSWLRATLNLRSVAIVVAAAAVKARLDAGQSGASRQVVNAALNRADEPGEFLAYWDTTYGKPIPKPVKRGVADAASRLYTQRAYLRNKGKTGRFSLADVLNLTHPTPTGPTQDALFRYILDTTYGKDGDTTGLNVLAARRELAQFTPDQVRELVRAPDARNRLTQAAVSWEALAGYLNGSLDGPAWAALVPSMGYQALLMNLRNMEQASVDDVTLQEVTGRLTDPDEVARSRMLPLAFLSAYRNTSLRFSWALEQALNLSLSGVPALPGRTLVLVDCSGSMSYPLSKKGTLTRMDAATVFGSAFALRADQADLVAYGTTSVPVTYRKGESVLQVSGRFTDMGGTFTREAVDGHYNGHDRIVLITDEQASPYTTMTRYSSVRSSQGGVFAGVPETVPTFTWNVAGYEAGHDRSGAVNRHTFGGLSDTGFELLPLLERGFDTGWPF